MRGARSDIDEVRRLAGALAEKKEQPSSDDKPPVSSRGIIDELDEELERHQRLQARFSTYKQGITKSSDELKDSSALGEAEANVELSGDDKLPSQRVASVVTTVAELDIRQAAINFGIEPGGSILDIFRVLTDNSNMGEAAVQCGLSHDASLSDIMAFFLDLNLGPAVENLYPGHHGDSSLIELIDCANSGFVIVGHGSLRRDGSSPYPRKKNVILRSINAAVLEPFSTDDYCGLSCVAANGSEIVAVGEEGSVWVSMDGGVIWVRQDPPVRTNLRCVRCIDGRYIAVGDFGAVITSEDAVSWTLQTSGVQRNLNSITSANGYTLIVGDQGTALISQDHVNFGALETNTRDNIFASTDDGNQFIAVGEHGVMLLITHDGGHVIPQRSGTEKSLFAIAYDKIQAIAIAVGEDGTILAWRSNYNECVRQNSGTTNNLYALIYALGGLFVAVGEGGTVLTSPLIDEGPWNLQQSNTIDALYGVTYFSWREPVSYAPSSNSVVNDIAIRLSDVDPNILETSPCALNINLDVLTATDRTTVPHLLDATPDDD
ncbi:MAG: hypothetical protein LBL30_00535 [Holosporales bacterium]|nr:hypothetical protein [Holosporales bacterium]